MEFKGKSFSIEIWHDINESMLQDIEFHLTYKGQKYFGWAFTIAKINEVMSNHKKSGESFHGAYFWVSGLIILEEITIDHLMSSISDLISDGSVVIEDVFVKINDE